MQSLRHRHFRIACALFAFFVLTGDIVADAIHDAIGVCATESQDAGHDACPSCGCTIHHGNAAVTDTGALLGSAPIAVASLLLSDDPLVAGAPPAIDHPPQLA